MVNCVMETMPTTGNLCGGRPGASVAISAFGRSAGHLGTALLEKFQTQKTASLLAYLAFYCDRRHTREELIDLLRPDAELEAGRNRFSQALVWLRPRLELSTMCAGRFFWPIGRLPL